VGDDWYQRRRQDDEGDFFRKVAAQGPRGGKTTSSNQGVYCLTADGRLLGYIPGDVDPARMKEMIESSLAKWRRLPAQVRRPNAIEVGEPAKVDPRYDRHPPEGGLIIEVHTRALERDEAQGFRDAECEFGDATATDHLWITREEAEQLRSPRPNATPKVGDSWPVPDAVARRIARFNLVDNTRGEPFHWSNEQLREFGMTLTVTEVTPDVVRLRLEGRFELTNEHEPQPQPDRRGFVGTILGRLAYDRASQTWTQFDLVAVGDHWGTPGIVEPGRPGKAPVGVAFRLVVTPSPADLVPPQAARDLFNYYKPDRY